jgi:hypothetical protein
MSELDDCIREEEKQEFAGKAIIGMFLTLAGVVALSIGVNECKDKKEIREQKYKQKVEQEIIQKYNIDTIKCNSSKYFISNKK